MNYSGTDATLDQLLLHEIGHALGLADNSDPNSIMYDAATANNRTLDQNDRIGAQLLYPTANSLDAQILRLVAATATNFDNSGGFGASGAIPMDPTAVASSSQTAFSLAQHVTH